LRPKPSRLNFACICALIAPVFFLPVCAKAQTGSVTLTGVVSETVALSVLPNSIDGNVVTHVVQSGNTVTVVVSGENATHAEFRVPLLVRSNSGFKISAVVEPGTAKMTQFSIVDVRGTGPLVSPAAINEVMGRRLEVTKEVSASTDKDLTGQTVIASGPRVSLGGTLNSPNNALQIMVLIRLEPSSAPGQLVRLSFAAAPVSPGP
jgi:hypothetical protein